MSKKLEFLVPIGLGDLIYIKAILDSIKDNYDQINIAFHKELSVTYKNNIEYNTFLDKIGNLFFSEKPYQIVDKVSKNLYNHSHISSFLNIPPVRPRLKHLLCSEIYKLQIEPYIILTTKIRSFNKNHYNEIYSELWNTIKKLSEKYKIVILGERMIEMNTEYQYHGSNFIYGIYDDIIKNISKERILDCTIPALGITTPDLNQIIKDCSIMRDAKFVITLGIGGNFCMATAVANTIGYRHDDDRVADILFNNKEYEDAFISKDFDKFIEKLRSQI